MESVLRITGIDGAGEKAKWDGETSLMTKAEMNLRARGLAPRVETTEAKAKPAKSPKVIDADAAPAKKAAAPKAAKTETKAAPAKKAPAKKADKAGDEA
jgi:large subunit ribosomal protein L21